jgi:hypothetical protein
MLDMPCVTGAMSVQHGGFVKFRGAPQQRAMNVFCYGFVPWQCRRLACKSYWMQLACLRYANGGMPQYLSAALRRPTEEWRTLEYPERAWLQWPL